MKTKLVACLPALAMLLAVVGDAAAADLRYRWKKASYYRFHTESDQSVAVSAGGMGGFNAKFKVDSTWALYVESVDPAGVASAVLVIESFTVTDSAGRVLATVDSLPKRALEVPLEIDSKGRFRFIELIYLVVTEEEEPMLVSASASAGPDGASASAQAGGHKVSVWVAFDRKTGRLKGGAKVAKVAKKKRKVVTLKREAQRIDVVPIEFLKLLRLPDGPVVAGTKATATIGDYQLDMTADALDAKTASLRTVLTTKAASSGEAPGGGMPGGMPEGMPEMPGGMGMPGPGGGGLGGALKMSGDWVMRFDVAQSQLLGIDGKLGVDMSQGPMARIKSDTVLKLKALR